MFWDMRGIFFQQNKKKIAKKNPRMFIGHQGFNFSHQKNEKSSAEVLGTSLVLYPYCI